MELSFQTATEIDVETIFQLNKELIDRYENLQDFPYEDVLNWVRRKINNNIDSYRRIYADGIHTGFYRFIFNGEQRELDDLYIFPEFQNQGIGTHVIENCLAESDGPVMLYVFIRNTRAWKLYQRLGFEIQETIHDSRYIMVRKQL